MNGMELSRDFFERNRMALMEKFPEVYERMAVGLVGEGSECFGYDDDVSKDHDYEPSFCIWLNESDYERFSDEIQEFYLSLKNPEEDVFFSAYGKDRRGVFCIDSFYKSKTGGSKGPDKLVDWLFVPEHSLAEAVNGEVFYDGLGVFSDIRSKLLQGYPEDVRKKKIAARAALMAQSGQYNYRRCLLHGEEGAARLALDEFVRHSIHMVHLLNNQYCPYYKWMLRKMGQLEVLGGLVNGLTALLCAPDTEENIQVKQNIIEQVSAQIAMEMKVQKLTDAESDYLESHAFSVMEHIEDEKLRSLHVMAGV